MRLTRECDYAFVALAFLAGRAGGMAISCEDMARALTIPPDFLAKILQKLSRSGLVVAKHGPNGGYVLSRQPADVSFADVLLAIDEPLRLVECVEPHDCRCPRLSVCAILETMQVIHERLITALARVTLADLLPSLQRAPTSPEAPSSVMRP